MAAIDALKDGSVIVFIDGSNLHLTPKIVQEAMASEPAFGPLPIVATFDAEMKKQLGVVGYVAMKNASGFQEVTAALTKLRGNQPAPGGANRTLPEQWKDHRGRSLRATYVSSTAETVTFRLENGTESTVKLTTLSEVSQQRVAELARAAR